MCGIVGYIGEDGNGVTKILDGIGEILYRGYDSIGIAVLLDDQVKVFKRAHVEIDDLKDEIQGNQSCFVGIGHNRWATTGEVSDLNAHPHFDSDKNFFVVHNGVVDNYHDLREVLSKKGVEFCSQTDTEIIAHLLAEEYCGDLEKTLIRVFRMLHGANAILAMSKKEPNKLVAIKSGSPLLVCKNGIGVMIASDASAFKNQKDHHTPEYVVLDDGEVVTAFADSYVIKNDSVAVEKELILLEDEELGNEKGDYKFFMEKEIFEQGRVLENVVSGRMIVAKGIPKLGGIDDIADKLSRAQEFHFVGCGTAFHACLYAKLLLNRFGIRAQAHIASEFCHSHVIHDPRDVFVFISQSGETADTIEVLDEVRDVKHRLCLGIVNKQATTIPRKTNAGIHIRAGIEKGVASTKAFVAQLEGVALLATFLARQRNMTQDTGRRILQELKVMPQKVEEALSVNGPMMILANKYVALKNCYYLGRYFSWMVAMEGALKLKEISYVHAEAYPAGEMKHGPLALVDENFYNVVIMPYDSTFESNLVSISEIRARNSHVLAITTKDAPEINDANDVIRIPATLDFLQPILSVIPLQLFAYYITLKLEKNPDKPRNLAKAVTTK